jgi:hypothetical protein
MKMACKHKPQEKQMENTAKEKIIADICNREWEMFSKIHNEGGPADCQQNPDFFKKMRFCQFAAWNEETLQSYQQDLIQAAKEGRNPPQEKYAYMMEYTSPGAFEKIRSMLPPVTAEKQSHIADILALQIEWEREVDTKYPHMRSGGRPLTRDKDTPWLTSFETYLKCELQTYSLQTLQHYAAYVHKAHKEERNLALEIAEQTALAYGYPNLDAAEKAARKAATGE